MEIVSQRKFVHISPRKIRLVANAVKRTHDPKHALALLSVLPKRAALPLQKTLKTALADAKNTFGVTGSILLKNIMVDEGPTSKRWHAVARGVAHPIHKRTSHITVVLEAQ